MAINVTDVKTFKFYAHKVMPLVYDDSLSYYEFLCKVLQKLNEVISSNNEQNSVLEDFDREINEWELETDELFQQYKARIDEEIEKMETAVMGMQVEASTLEAGSEVTVSIELNEDGNYVISFGIPQGEKGDTGYPTQEQVASAVTTWLVANVDPVGSAVVVDSSLSVSGAAADAKVTGDTINEISTVLYNIDKNNYNLFTDVLNDGYININGGFRSDNNYKSTNYIPVKNGESFIYKLGHATTLPIIAFYNSNKEYVSENSVIGLNGYSEGTYTTSGDGFVKLTIYNSRTESNVIFTSNIATNVQNKIDIVTTIKSDEVYQKIYSIKTNNLSDGWINTSGTISTSGHYKHTDYIHIKSGETVSYRLSHGVANAPLIAYYTEAKVYDPTKSVLYSTGAYITDTYTATADGYIIFTFLEARDDVYAVFTPEIPDNVKLYYKNVAVQNLNVLLMGDSIFGNDGEIAENLNKWTKSTINGAFGGTRVTDRGGADNFRYFDGVNLVEALVTDTWTDQDTAAEALSQSYPWITERLADLKNVNLNTINVIIMDWGTNDYTGGATIEQITSAYNTVFELLQTYYPAIRILITTPIWRYWGTKQDNLNGDTRVYNVSTLKEIVNAIEQNCKNYRISVLNAYQNLPLTYETANTYFDANDGTHLNTSGNLMYAHLLHGKLSTLF